MPIDPMISDAMLGTFRNMIQDMKDKNLSGEHFDHACDVLNQMEELAQKHTDLNAFNGEIAQENLFAKFSDHYGRALSAEAEAAGSNDDGGYDDGALLKQTIDALKNAIKQIRDAKVQALKETQSYDPHARVDKSMEYLQRNMEQMGLGKDIQKAGGIEQIKKQSHKDVEKELKKKPAAYDNSAEIEALINDEAMTKPIEDLIDLGQQDGITYPQFLRIQIEKGLDKAMEGSVVVREGLVYDHEWAKANSPTPFHIEKTAKKIKLFDELAEKSKFNVPNSDELNFGEQYIDYEFEPGIILWREITERWEDLLWRLSFWSLSYCSFAPHIEPWSMAPDPKKSTIKTQNTSPGLYVQAERLFKKYFDLDALGALKHETFKWSVTDKRIGDSQEFVEFLINKVLPECKPNNHLPQEIITERESFYKEKREQNPEILVPLEKLITFYDKKFGEGRFVSKFGPPTPSDSTAKPWDWDSFIANY